ncbi:hypothetical protein C4544_04970 [candidate division WS5 bacterium]|uniref:Uncharacterized protein n=1 Tax=candidate division WS5 bacterium TaxID=2093353 RepID=A0A419DBU0_9BACT|nr:MAG: hypothetical protein C4544_04970 [candidate division WS5 bacterium]
MPDITRDDCKRGIELFIEARYEADSELSARYEAAGASAEYITAMEDMKRHNTQDDDIDYMLERGDGLRLGAMDYPHVKFRCDPDQRDSFYIHSNGMDKDDFLHLQEIVARKFEENGLKLVIMEH